MMMGAGAEEEEEGEEGGGLYFGGLVDRHGCGWPDALTSGAPMGGVRVSVSVSQRRWKKGLYTHW